MLAAPVLLREDHDLEPFLCGESTLDEWFKRRARANHAGGASRVFVICNEDEVVGFYSLSASSASPASLPGRFRRNMPDPVPVVLLGRLATHHRWQGKGIGRAMVKDAVMRTLQVSANVGVRALLVHAISDEVAQFYRRCGFVPCPHQPLTMVLALAGVLYA